MTGRGRFLRVQGKTVSKPKRGEGKITNNVSSLSIRSGVFTGLRPRCIAVALVDPNSPADQLPTPFDQTGELRLKGWRAPSARRVESRRAGG